MRTITPTPTQHAPESGMQMLYDSDVFVVVHVPYITDRHPASGFEIVDKRTNREVFLADDWARAFTRQIAFWQANIPAQDEVEAVLETYAMLAQLPLVMH
jgi:hypothetical protein